MPGTLAPMAKKKPPTENVRLDAELMRDIRIIAAAAGLSAPEWMASQLRPIVKRELAKVAKQLTDRQEE